MRKKVLISLVLLLMFSIKANASITVEQTTDPEYMINCGYSEAVAEDVMILKNRAYGKPVEPLYEKNTNGFVRFLKNCRAYIDPAIEGEDRYHHDIHLSPSYKDL